METSKTSDGFTAPARSTNANRLKQIRQWHLYLGTFFAPAIIFFALTGALQLFGLHEGHPGESYQPPKWIATLASIHKDQVLGRDHHDGPPPPPDLAPRSQGPGKAEAQALPEREGPAPGKATAILKWFFLAMSLGLVITTVLGVYMSFKYNRSRTLVWTLLLVGTALPAALIGLMA